MGYKPSSIAIFTTMHKEPILTAHRLTELSGAPKGSCDASCSQLVEVGLLENLGTLPFLMQTTSGRYITKHRSVFRLVDNVRKMPLEKAIEVMKDAERNSSEKRWAKNQHGRQKSA